MRRSVLLLAVCQALAMTGTSSLMTVGALAGKMLAPDPRMATLPFAIQFIATALSTIPASLLMARTGRRIGFTVGQLIGIAGAALAAYAIYVGSFWLFMAASPLLGVHNAVWQYYRFAAAEVSSAEYRARAISYVLAGGVVAAVAGPQLAILTVDLSAATFSATYAAMVGLSVAAIAILQFIDVPKPVPADYAGGGRRIAEIIRTPVFMVAATSSTIGYGVMNMLMTSTPLAMIGCGFGFGDSAHVIQWHVLGMFAPSFFTGHVIRRIGVVNVIVIGCALQAGAIAIAVAGVDWENFLFGLMALGVGWNFMFIGGTTLLTESYAPDERAKTQAAHDFMVFAMVALTAYSSGFLHETLGWVSVNLIAAVPVSLAFVAAVWFRLATGARRAAS